MSDLPELIVDGHPGTFMRARDTVRVDGPLPTVTEIRVPDNAPGVHWLTVSDVEAL